MRIGRVFIIPAILALGIAGSALTGAVIPAAATAAPVAVHSMHFHGTPLADGSGTSGTNMYHHG